MKHFILAPLFLLAACGAPDMFLASPQIATTERVASRFATIELREVSLPAHAASEEIYLEAEGGGLAASELLWADDPTRAVTLALSRNLSEITGARIAPEPWPFDAYPAARVDVRVERFLTSADGLLTLSGQYFVADLEGLGRDRSRLFTLSHQIESLATPAAEAEVRARLVADLALLIARDGL